MIAKWFKRLVVGLVVLVIALMVLGFWMGSGQPRPISSYPAPLPEPIAKAPAETQPSGPTWDSSPDAVAKRLKLITTLQHEGIFGDLHIAGGVGVVIVKPAFYALDFKQKSAFASVAFTWCLDQDAKAIVLVLHDSMDNREVGRFGTVYGGLKMN